MTENLPNDQHVHIIGAGIVGVCAALWLQKAGYQVTLVDPSGIGQETSSGNAGGIAVTDIVPLSVPGVWKNIPKWLIDPLGPLAVRFSYLPWLAPWGLRFLANADQDRLKHIIAGRGNLCSAAWEAWHPLIRAAGIEGMVGDGEALTLYESEQEYQDDLFKWEMRAANSVKWERLDRAEMRELEPELSEHLHCAVINRDWRHVSDPKTFTESLGKLALNNGGTLIKAGVRGLVRSDNRVSAIVLDNGDSLKISNLVIAAGAWSRKLTEMLGCNVPLETERGYHTTLANPGITPGRMFIYNAQGFVVTPMSMGLRVAGTVELAGLEAAPDYRRASILVEKARRILPALRSEGRSVWMGHRPSLPDSMPVISRVPSVSNVTAAFGHDHLGLTMAAITGKLVSQIIRNETTDLDTSPYDIQRFN